MELGARVLVLEEQALDGLGFVGIDGAERERAEQVAGVAAAWFVHGVLPMSRASTRSRSRRSPVRMRDLTVPSGAPSTLATSR